VLRHETLKELTAMSRTTKTKTPKPALPILENPEAGVRVELVPLETATAMAHQKNPKEHDVPALVASYRRFGFVAPPTIDEKTQVMVAGHGRCQALAQMKAAGEPAPAGIKVDPNDGGWSVPILRGIVFENDRERDAYVIADNQHTINGGWNIDQLSSLLAEIRIDGVDGFGLDGLGFDAVELGGLLSRFNEPEPKVDPEPTGATSDDPPKPEDDGKFVHHDINVQTTYCCPKCSYEWSGKAK
jgi:hypothetical protein